MFRSKSVHGAPPARFSFLLLVGAALAFALPAAADVEAAAPAAPAGPPGVIAGRVVHDGAPVAAGEAILVDLRRRVSLGADGGFRFEVPPGTYLVEIRTSDLPVAVERVTVAAGGETAVEIALHRPVLHDEVFVTAGGGVLSQLEVAQPTDVLAGDDLDRRRQATLGETLAAQPGVSSTSFGPGASRPVIRGLGGDRVRMLQDGLGSADASSASPDHAVAVDPLSAERIEVLRGPATLLYGSSAVGGVVNVLDGRIPDHLPGAAVSGSAELLGGSAADERSGAVTLTGAAGRIAWHADVLRRETDDVEIPGHAEVEGAHEGEDEREEERGPEGVLANSALEAEGAGLGLSWIGDAGFVGVAVSGFDTLYGVPGHAHEGGEEHGPGGGVRVDLEQRRVDLAGQWNRGFGVFRGARVRLGVNEYEHRELEGAEVGTRFTNDAWEGRLELIQERRGRLTGSIGLQAGSSDFAAVGEEAFVPPSTTDTLAVFAFQNVAISERVKVQFGGRWERQLADPDNEAPDRDLDGFSASAGVVFAPVEGWSLAGSLARTTRLPTAAELYADGPHAATGAFEIGDPGFAQETSLGLDLSLRKTTGRVTGVLNLFANRFDDYIFESFTGEKEDGLQVIRFRQADAEFVGAELDTLTRIAEFGDDAHLDLRLGADLTGSGDPLPRIPPLRILAGLEVHRGPLRVGVEARRVDDQDRLGEDETPTDGYTLLGASVAYRFVAARTVTEVVLRGSNLTDEEARNHVSFLKDLAPLPGRDVNLMLRVSF